MNLETRLNLPVFAALFLAVVAVVVTLSYDNKEKISGESLLYPNLKDKLAGIVAINIDVGTDDQTTLIRGADKDSWYVAEMDGYPADNAKVRHLFDTLADLESFGVVDANPAAFAKYGVEEPAAESRVVRLALVNMAGGTPVNLLIGKHKSNKESEYIYVRKEGAVRVMQVKDLHFLSSLRAGGDFVFVDHLLFLLEPKDIAKITMTDLETKRPEMLTLVQAEDGALSFRANFKMQEPVPTAEGKRLIGAFGVFSWRKAARAETLAAKGEMRTIFKTEVETLTGKVYVINFVKVGEKELWLQVYLIGGADEAGDDLLAADSGWLYQISADAMQAILPPLQMAE